MHLPIVVLIILHFGLYSNGGDPYPSYTILYDPVKSLEWSDDRTLAYITTVRLFDYDHHIFQYRRYPCQYFYTDEIQMNYNNETINECIYNTTTSDYEYSFQLHLHSLHIEPYILRNLAIQCKYINCSLSLLVMKYISIDWNLQGRNNNINCSFDTTKHYNIYVSPYSLSEWITLRCKSIFACSSSKRNLERALSSNIQLIYGSSYGLETPYCSLEKSLAYVIETNLAQTNLLLEQLVNTIQRGFGKPDEREQAHMKEYVEQKWIHNETNSTTNKTGILGEAQGTFIITK
jgi:hypothetical protein